RGAAREQGHDRRPRRLLAPVDGRVHGQAAGAGRRADGIHLPGKQPVRHRGRASEPVRSIKGAARMSSRSRTIVFAVAVALNAGLLGLTAVAQQDPPQPMAEQVFKNIQVLKGIPADEFMDTMGMFASSLVYDCTGCHVQEILINRDAFATPTPRIQRARQMVVMVNALNRMYFGGQPKVTCFTCHRASGFPEVIPDLSLQYGDGPPDNPNAMTIFPQREGPSADEIFRKYIDAVGGM